MSHIPPPVTLQPPAPGAPPASSYGLRRPAAAEPAPRALVRVTQPELMRRAILERTRGRLVIAALGFAGLFGAVALKLAFATVIQPADGRRAAIPLPPPRPRPPRRRWRAPP